MTGSETVIMPGAPMTLSAAGRWRLTYDGDGGSSPAAALLGETRARRRASTAARALQNVQTLALVGGAR